MKVLEINSVPYGSTGHIMFGIARVASEHGIIADTATGYSTHPIKELPDNHIQIGGVVGKSVHLAVSRLTGKNGCYSRKATQKLLRHIERENYDLLHLHNLHGWYINIPMLFNYIKKHNISIVWTLHDCWAMTGQCPYFTMVKCDKWKIGCHDCPQYKQYPASYVDRTKTMWKLKKKWFTGVQNMTIVTPSQWLADLVKESFLAEYPVKVINNGIDLSVFKPTKNDFREVYGLQNKKIVLGVAFGWGDRKGYRDCLKLAELLNEDYHLVLVGVSKEQIATLPKNVLGIERTNSQKELAAIYSASDVFTNTTYEDNYPTVNLEARACGLPIITYRTGGSPESAGTDAVVVEVGDIQGLKKAIEATIQTKKQQTEDEEISSEAKFAKYIELYNSAKARETVHKTNIY